MSDYFPLLLIVLAIPMIYSSVFFVLERRGNSSNKSYLRFIFLFPIFYILFFVLFYYLSSFIIFVILIKLHKEVDPYLFVVYLIVFTSLCWILFFINIEVQYRKSKKLLRCNLKQRKFSMSLMKFR